MSMRKWMVTAALGATLMVGVASVSAQPGQPGHVGRGDRGLIGAGLAAAIEETGLDRAALLDGLRNGSTLSELVTEAGGDIQAVIDAAVAAGQERIDAAVASGNLTAEQGATLTQELADRIAAAVNGEAVPRWVERGALRIAGIRELVNAVSDATGLTAREIVQQVRSGSSLSDIAAANDATTDEIVQAAVASATERLNSAVSNGSMTQTQADLVLESLAERFTEAMSVVPGVTTTQQGQGV